MALSPVTVWPPDNYPATDEQKQLARAFLDYAQHVRQLSLCTLRWYREALANLFRFLATSKRDLPESAFELDEWVAWNARRGIKRPTINSYWRGVRPFFKYRADRLEKPNPFAGAIKPDGEREEDRVRDALTPEQLAVILDAAEHYPWRSHLERSRAAALVAIMIYAGLRKREVLRLKFAHVDLGASRLTVSRGKGRRGGKDRVVYMPATLKRILEDYVSVRASYTLKVEGKPQKGFSCPAFFVSSRANRGLSEVQFRRIISAIRRASSVRFFPHLLRHSYITMLVTEHVPLHDVQQMAGHSDLKTTARYLHANSDRMRAAVHHLDVRRTPARS